MTRGSELLLKISPPNRELAGRYFDEGEGTRQAEWPMAALEEKPGSFLEPLQAAIDEPRAE